MNGERRVVALCGIGVLVTVALLGALFLVWSTISHEGLTAGHSEDPFSNTVKPSPPFRDNPEISDGSGYLKQNVD